MNRCSAQSCRRSRIKSTIGLAFLRLAETLTAFLARLRSNAETLDVAERQRIVRLVVKEVLVGENDITIRHSIPIPSGPPPNGGSPLGPTLKLPFV